MFVFRTLCVSVRQCIGAKYLFLPPHYLKNILILACVLILKYNTVKINYTIHYIYMNIVYSQYIQTNVTDTQHTYVTIIFIYKNVR